MYHTLILSIIVLYFQLNMTICWKLMCIFFFSRRTKYRCFTTINDWRPSNKLIIQPFPNFTERLLRQYVNFGIIIYFSIYQKMFTSCQLRLRPNHHKFLFLIAQLLTLKYEKLSSIEYVKVLTLFTYLLIHTEFLIWWKVPTRYKQS